MTSGVELAELGAVANVTDFVANGSFEALRQNVRTSTQPGYAVLVRLVDHKAGWQGPFSYVDKPSCDFLGKTAIGPGDVIVANVGANAGTVFRAPELDRPMTLGPNAVLCKARDPRRLSRTYLYYFLASPQGQQLISGILSGSAQPKFNKTDFRKIPILLPSIAVQVAIADVLSALDDKIVANGRLGTGAMELAGLTFDQAISGQPVRPMSSLLKPILGGTPSRSRDDFWAPGQHPWASAKDVAGAAAGVVIDTLEQISDAAITQTKARPLPRGSVVLTARGTVGAVARLGEPMSFNQSCYGFVPGTLPPGVLYFSILRATERAKAIAHGSVFDTITMRTFDHLEVVDFDSQAWAAVEARVAPLLAVAEQRVRESKNIAETRDALLPQLISGKIRVRDAERVVERIV